MPVRAYLCPAGHTRHAGCISVGGEGSPARMARIARRSDEPLVVPGPQSRGPEAVWPGKPEVRRRSGPESPRSGGGLARKARGPEAVWPGKPEVRRRSGPESPRSGGGLLACLARDVVAEDSLNPAAAGSPTPPRHRREPTATPPRARRDTAASPPRHRREPAAKRLLSWSPNAWPVGPPMAGPSQCRCSSAIRPNGYPQDRRFRVDRARVGGGANPGGPEWWRAGVVEGRAAG